MAPSAAHSDLADGLSAYSRQDYAQAFNEWQPLVNVFMGPGVHVFLEARSFFDAKEGNARLCQEAEERLQIPDQTERELALVRATIAINPRCDHHDPTLAYRYLQQSASSGFAPAEYCLAMLLLAGDASDGGTARSWLLHAAESGNAHFMLQLGLVDLTGAGGRFPRDPLSAYKWLRLTEMSVSADYWKRIAQIRALAEQEITADQMRTMEKEVRAWEPPLR